MRAFNTSTKRRLDIELSLYLFSCLALFVIASILGSVILVQQERHKVSLAEQRISDNLFSKFKENLPFNLTPTQRDNVLAITVEYHDKLKHATSWHAANNNLLIFVSALFAIFVLVLFLLTSSWVQVRLFGPISELIDISAHNDALIRLSTFETQSADIEILCNLFANLVKHRIEKEKQGKQLAILEKKAAVASISAQVAHDIRSPLAALAILEHDLAVLPENKRVLMRSAIRRIRDISNNLLEKNRDLGMNEHGSNTMTEPPSSQLIAALLEQLIAEKRTEYCSKINIKIQDNLDSKSYGLFAMVQPIELKRIISNFINNAVEALSQSGTVILGLDAYEAHIEISVTDNGCGIAKEILPRLMNRGETYGKIGGSGLGLYHARKTLELWNGTIDINSTAGSGTKVTVSLAKTSAPNWFVEQIIIRPTMKIIIVDDDPSIHQIWRYRLASIRKATDIEIMHCSTPNEFQNHVEQNVLFTQNILFLFDYEFFGHEESGLDLIEKNRIAPYSILITSKFEETPIRERSEQLGVKLIPKGLAGFVPIVLEE